MNEWISAKKKMPEPNVDVLFLNDGGHCHVGMYFPKFGDFSGGWIVSVDTWGAPDFDMDEVSHWMPLPELPKE